MNPKVRQDKIDKGDPTTASRALLRHKARRAVSERDWTRISASSRPIGKPKLVRLAAGVGGRAQEEKIAARSPGQHFWFGPLGFCLTARSNFAKPFRGSIVPPVSLFSSRPNNFQQQIVTALGHGDADSRQWRRPEQTNSEMGPIIKGASTCEGG
jgi:hypothetical protein